MSSLSFDPFQFGKCRLTNHMMNWIRSGKPHELDIRDSVSYMTWGLRNKSVLVANKHDLSLLGLSLLKSYDNDITTKKDTCLPITYLAKQHGVGLIYSLDDDTIWRKLTDLCNMKSSYRDNGRANLMNNMNDLKNIDFVDRKYKTLLLLKNNIYIDDLFDNKFERFDFIQIEKGETTTPIDRLFALLLSNYWSSVGLNRNMTRLLNKKANQSDVYETSCLMYKYNNRNYLVL